MFLHNIGVCLFNPMKGMEGGGEIHGEGSTADKEKGTKKKGCEGIRQEEEEPGREGCDRENSQTCTAVKERQGRGR